MTFKAERYVSLNRDQKEAENDPFTAQRYRQFASCLKNDTPYVLDVGCSTGIGGTSFKERIPGARLVGMDCLASRVEQLPTTVYEKTIVGYSTDLPAEDNTFDAIIAGEFIEHVAPAEVDLTFAEFFRVLKLGGVLLLTTPNPHYVRHAVGPLLGRWQADQRVLGGAHISQHFPGVLRLRLRMVGFSSVRLLGSGRVSWFIGQRIPFLPLYGSYMVTAKKW